MVRIQTQYIAIRRFVRPVALQSFLSGVCTHKIELDEATHTHTEHTHCRLSSIFA